MSIRPIVYLGDERLITPSKSITEVDASLQTLIEDMFETMYASNGIGLAAPQLGINLQLTVIDVTENRSQKLCFINPQIVSQHGEVKMMEGCLSIPGPYEEVTRPESVTIKALDRTGKPFETTADGLLARCIQHEYDHLQGKLFIDYLSPLKRQRAIEKYTKTMRQRKK